MPDETPRRYEPDPSSIITRQDFARELTLLRERAGLTVRDVARAADVPDSTVGGYFAGAHLPSLKPPNLLADILRACGVADPAVVEQWRQALTRVRRVPGRRPASAPVPYRGLASFQPEDAEWFYGRERLTGLLVERLAGEHTADAPLVVVGPSGSGKSSLLRAGLIAALQDRDGWSLRLLTPGSHPLQELERLDGGRAAGRLVVVVDQFEEVFTACDDEAERQSFIAAVCAAAERDLVVLGLRADFYAHALRHPQLTRAVQDAQVVVGPMTEDEIRRAILEPARQAGLEVEDGLVELLLRDIAPANAVHATPAAHDAGALPLLSHALLATWERGKRRTLTVADYRASGGIDGAVASSADAVYQELSDERRHLARWLFLRLVHLADDAADTRRRVRRTELLQEQGEGQAAALQFVLDRFVEQRLLTVDTDTVEITHEALLWAWPRLRAWIDSDRAALLTGQRLTEAAELWRREQRDPALLYRGARLPAAREWADGHPRQVTSPIRDFLNASIRRERRRTRRLYQVIAALSALALAAACLAGYAFEQRTVAVNQRALAVSRLVATEAERVRDSDVSLAMQLSLAAYRIAPTNEARSSLLSSSASPVATRLVGPFKGGILSSAFSPDGRTLATSPDQTVQLWDVSSRRPALLSSPLPGPGDPVYSVAFSPDGRTLAAGAGRTVRLWQVTDPRQPRPIGTLTGPTDAIRSVAYSPDGTILAAGGIDQTVRLWQVTDLRRPRPLATLTGPGGTVESVAVSPDGRTLAAGTKDFLIWLWDLRDPRRPARLTTPLAGPRKTVESVAFSPDGRTLAAASRDQKVWLWNLRDPRRPAPLGAPLSGPASILNTVSISPDGTTLAAGSSDGNAWVWDLASRRVIATLPHPQPVISVTFGRDSHTLATGSADGIERLWHLPGPILVGPTDSVFTVAFSPDGRTLAAISRDKKVWLWDLAQPRPATLRPLTSTSASVTLDGAGTLSRDGRILAAGSVEGPVQLWDVSHPRSPVPLGRPLTGPTATVQAAAFSPDRRVLAASGDDLEVRLWDVANPRRPHPLATLTGATNSVYFLSFSPDGHTLAAASFDKTVRLWDVSDPSRSHPLAVLTGPTDAVFSVVFSPDGRTLAAGGSDKTVRLWNVSDPRRAVPLGPPLRGPTGGLWWLAFSPDGRTLAASTTDHTVWMWDVADPARPHVLATLTGPTGEVLSVAFSPDGRTLAAGGADTRVRLWDTDPDQAAAYVCSVAGTPLTREEWNQYIPAPYRPVCGGGT